MKYRWWVTNISHLNELYNLLQDDSNNVVDIKELRGERNYSPKVISYLISMGILNSGLC